MKRKNEVSERMKRPCALGVRAAAVFAVSAALVAGLALAGCGAFQPEQPASQAPASDSEASAQKAPAAYTFTDDLGNEVTVENPVSYTHLDVYKRQWKFWLSDSAGL